MNEAGGSASGGRPLKKKKKGDMIDSFIDGELQLEEVVTKMNEERKHSKAVNASLRDNKRLSEMLSKKIADLPPPAQSKSGFFTLNDFLNDMEDDDESLSSSLSSKEKIKTLRGGASNLL